MIAAQSLGLGSIRVSAPNAAFDESPGVEILNLSESEGLFVCILIGYPAVIPESPPKKPLQVKRV